MLHIEWLSQRDGSIEGEPIEVGLTEMLKANEYDVELCAELRGLGVGASTMVGGGAAALCRITRIA